MRVVSIEDARRVFVTTVKLIYLNNTETFVTYELTRNQDRTNLPNNSGDVINIPSRKFKNALSRVLKVFHLHEEQKSDFINAFIELHWIMRPKDQRRRYKRETTSRCKVGGKEAAVYRIDRIIFDYLDGMEGVLARDISNNPVYVPQRGPDGDLRTSGGNTVPTTVTAGTVCDADYSSISRQLASKIGGR